MIRFCAPALAASAGCPVGTSRRRRLPEPPRSCGCPTGAHLDGTECARRRRAQPGEHGIVMATPLSTLLKTRESPLRFEPVDRLERQKLVQHGQDVQRFREERQKLEARAATQSAGQAANRFAPSSAKLPMSPIAARPNAELGKDHIPPQLHVAPKPDLTVEAKPRPNRVPEQPQHRTVNKIPLDTKPPPANVPAKPARVDRPAPQPQPQPQPKAERPARRACRSSGPTAAAQSRSAGSATPAPSGAGGTEP